MVRLDAGLKKRLLLQRSDTHPQEAAGMEPTVYVEGLEQTLQGR